MEPARASSFSTQQHMENAVSPLDTHDHVPSVVGVGPSRAIRRVNLLASTVLASASGARAASSSGQQQHHGGPSTDGAPPSSSTSDDVSCDVLIVGGGAGGMALAHELLRNSNSLRILLLEKRNVLGGSDRLFGKKSERRASMLKNSPSGSIFGPAFDALAPTEVAFQKLEQVLLSGDVLLDGEANADEQQQDTRGQDEKSRGQLQVISCRAEINRPKPCLRVQKDSQAVAVFADGYVGVSAEGGEAYQLVKPRKALVLACGARDGYCIFPGNDLPNVVFWEAAARIARPGGRATVVIGGTDTAFEAAKELHSRGGSLKAVLCPEGVSAKDVHVQEVLGLGIPVLFVCDIVAALPPAEEDDSCSAVFVRNETTTTGAGKIGSGNEGNGNYGDASSASSSSSSSSSRSKNKSKSRSTAPVDRVLARDWLNGGALCEFEAKLVVVATESVPARELAEKSREWGTVPTLEILSTGGDLSKTFSAAQAVAQDVLSVAEGRRMKAAKSAEMVSDATLRQIAAQLPDIEDLKSNSCSTTSSCPEMNSQNKCCKNEDKNNSSSCTKNGKNLLDATTLAKIDPNSAIVCRCEKVNLGQIKEAITASGGDMNRIKQMTRQGMGYCGGFQCTAAVAKLIDGARSADSNKVNGLVSSGSGRTRTRSDVEDQDVHVKDAPSGRSSSTPPKQGSAPTTATSTTSTTIRSNMDPRHQRPLNLELSLGALAKAAPPPEAMASRKPQLDSEQQFSDQRSKYDIIVLGAGAIGTPTALYLKQHFGRVLCLDMHPSSGQGDNKRALGGVRATFGNPGKIVVGLDSVDILRNWQKTTGDDIDWKDGGYLFPFYSEVEEAKLTKLLPIQQKYGLDIKYVDAARVQQLVPGIDPKGLRGGVYSCKDGQATPYLTSLSMLRLAQQNGVEFKFKHRTLSFLLDKSGRVEGVAAQDMQTGEIKRFYASTMVINALGATCNELISTLGYSLKMEVDSHDAAVTGPCRSLNIQPLVVDIRTADGSSCFYFYQNHRKQLVLSNAPEPRVTGYDTSETSHFLPNLARRLLKLLPDAGDAVEVRRVWRGLYANTADGNPLVGFDPYHQGLFHATGMGGQGFMLGPGVGKLIARVLTNQKEKFDDVCLKEFAPFRSFDGAQEALR
ncbi:unnamed protein product [Amoebophrya sp. A25]|nr:unnamed protein product [Amoebophrya sp. A25]|eukprot:GSA25T00010887001.1